jgi:hypothetical protein
LNCPNKICRLEIPEDSCFCDQCGTPLLKCEKCGFIGTSKHCGKCGCAMSSIKPPDAGPSLSSQSTPAAPSLASAPASAPSAATRIISLPSEKILLCHLDGWNMEITDGNILGRTNGPHAAALGKFPVISSNHAKVTRANNEWFITDLNSTNKTYVNGVKLEPNVPVKINQNDVVILANITFTVRLA